MCQNIDQSDLALLLLNINKHYPYPKGHTVLDNWRKPLVVSV